MTLLIVISLVVVFVVCGAWLHFFVERTLRQQLQALSMSACPSCGKPYGAAAAERARQEHLARCHEAQRQHPHLKINFVRFWEVRCPQCGAEARFHYETESLVASAAQPQHPADGS